MRRARARRTHMQGPKRYKIVKRVRWGDMAPSYAEKSRYGGWGLAEHKMFQAEEELAGRSPRDKHSAREHEAAEEKKIQLRHKALAALLNIDYWPPPVKVVEVPEHAPPELIVPGIVPAECVDIPNVAQQQTLDGGGGGGDGSSRTVARPTTLEGGPMAPSPRPPPALPVPLPPYLPQQQHHHQQQPPPGMRMMRAPPPPPPPPMLRASPHPPPYAAGWQPQPPRAPYPPPRFLPPPPRLFYAPPPPPPRPPYR